MPYRKRRAPARRRRPAVGRKTQRIRKLAGQKPVTWAESLARSAGPIGKLASSVATIAGLVNSETKFNDVVVSGTGISNSGGFSQYMTNIAEGDDYTQRNGRVILSKNFYMKMRVRGDTGATSGNTLGWALIMDKESSIDLSVTPWTDVFVNTDPQSPITKANSERFIILKRGLITTTPGGSNIKYQNVMINLKGIHLKFDGVNATDRDQNAIFLIAVSDQATLVPALFVQARYNYHDN